MRGNTLSKQNDLSQKLLDSITDEIYKYDANGLMFYDLNPNNILVENDEAGFIDFEFMEYKKQIHPKNRKKWTREKSKTACKKIFKIAF